jgi:hypothetical protein
MVGVNMFSWNIVQNWGSVYDPSKWSEIGFVHSFRHYIGWNTLEPSKGVYDFTGNWNLDAVYNKLESEGKTIFICIKGLPGYLQSTYPNGGDPELNPTYYGSDLSDTLSYIDSYRLWKTVATRYKGRKVWYEIENERNKWWKGRNGYQTAREYAAYLYMCAKAIREVDPAAKVSIGGIADNNTDYFKGIIDWYKEYQEGKLNFDALNYHVYASDANQQYASSKGVSPEQAKVYENHLPQLTLAQQHGLKCFIGEIGYDHSPYSTQGPPEIPGFTVEQTVANWNLRSMLMLSRAKLNGLQFYMWDNVTEDLSNGGVYNTSGWHSGGGSTFKYRTTALYAKQALQLLGNYHYESTLQHSPEIDVYDSAGVKMYVAWMPTSNNSKASYSNGQKLKFHALSLEGGLTTGEGTAIEITETPVFFQSIESQNPGSAVTPAAPVVTGDDLSDSLSASSSLGNSEIEVSENGGVWQAYTGIIKVGNIARPQGYWKFKIKAIPGRNESAIAESPVFSIASVQPPLAVSEPPILSANDITDVLSVSSPLGISEILMSEDGGQWLPYTGQINVGNVARVHGYWKFKIRAALERSESNIVESPAFTITVVNIVPQPPVVSLFSSTGGEFIAPANIILLATASDVDGTVTKVEFFANAIKIGETISSPYSFNWNNVSAGNYVITAKAIDNSGLSTISQSLRVQIGKPKRAPKIAITSPVNESTFKMESNIVFTADATDEDGSIKKVEFYSNGVKLGETQTYPYSFRWNDVQTSNYSITAKAIDNDDLVAVSETLTIHVTANRQLIVYPNPVKNIAQIQFSVPAAAYAEVEIYNLQGSLMGYAFRGRLGAKEIKQVTFDASNLSNGMYICRVKYGNGTSYKKTLLETKFVVMK